jgi:hypothetical protein
MCHLVERIWTVIIVQNRGYWKYYIKMVKPEEWALPVDGGRYNNGKQLLLCNNSGSCCFLCGQFPSQQWVNATVEVFSLWSDHRYPSYPVPGGVAGQPKSKSHYDRRLVVQCVLVSSPVWGSWPDVNYCLTVTVLSISGAPSDERSGLSFVLVTWTTSVQYSRFAAGPRQHSIFPYL